MADVSPLWIAAVTGGTSLVTAAIGAGAGLWGARLSNKHAIAMRTLELEADEKSRSATAAETRVATMRAAIVEAHIALVTGLQQAMLASQRALAHSGTPAYWKIIEEAQALAATASSHLETLQVTLSQPVAEAARDMFDQVVNYLQELRDVHTSTKITTSDEAIAAFETLRDTYTPMLRGELDRIRRLGGDI